MKQQVEIAKIEHIGMHPRLGGDQTIPINMVIKHGYTDFTLEEDVYDATKHTIIEKEFAFIPIIQEQDWYWNATTEEFQS